ncbi:MAG: hypothetical protein ACD_64C00037G0002 [uncultured bacterium]|nr:MAG: hypothetical protein ACD_64C00037G0002 [uncultured bacterium]
MLTSCRTVIHDVLKSGMVHRILVVFLSAGCISNSLLEGRVMARSLKTYQKKRDFKITIEPAGIEQYSSSRPKFVIQQHAARAMHYDVRLEIDGVLVSWAVPKGPSLNPAVKRLAIMTEDHPMEYRDFEGIIPEGEYGAGPVIIWDRGTYKNLRDVSMNESLKQGQLEVFLYGKKVRGAFVFIRTAPKSVEKSRWLLIKMRDDYADARKNPVSSQPESVKTGKTIKDWKKKITKKENAEA